MIIQWIERIFILFSHLSHITHPLLNQFQSWFFSLFIHIPFWYFCKWNLELWRKKQQQKFNSLYFVYFTVACFVLIFHYNRFLFVFVQKEKQQQHALQYQTNKKLFVNEIISNVVFSLSATNQFFFNEIFRGICNLHAYSYSPICFYLFYNNEHVWFNFKFYVHRSKYTVFIGII